MKTNEKENRTFVFCFFFWTLKCAKTFLEEEEEEEEKKIPQNARRV